MNRIGRYEQSLREPPPRISVSVDLTPSFQKAASPPRPRQHQSLCVQTVMQYTADAETDRRGAACRDVYGKCVPPTISAASVLNYASVTATVSRSISVSHCRVCVTVAVFLNSAGQPATFCGYSAKQLQQTARRKLSIFNCYLRLWKRLSDPVFLRQRRRKLKWILTTINSFLHCALASGAVYCNRSCL